MKRKNVWYNKNVANGNSSNSGFVTGIDEVGMDNLILDINDKIDLCNSILNDIEDCVDNVLLKYQSDDKSLMQQKFQELKSNFPILISNLETYSSDLVRVKNGYHSIDEIASAKIRIGNTDLNKGGE